MDPNRSLGWLIGDVSRLLRKRFDLRARDLGLTRAQYYLLGKLSRHEGINQVGLADMLEVEPITLARLVDRMENGGWIERRPDPADRRARRLYLTGKSHPVLERMQAIANAVYDEALAELPAASREKLIDTLQQVRRNLAEIGADASTAATDDTRVEPAPRRAAAGARG
ncbi:MAG: MarR family transcriptional regulator [Rhodospirillaceae bacterium]|nr:MarR family transcriptional regulator [Rhodospirillaceae bacterium]